MSTFVLRNFGGLVMSGFQVTEGEIRRTFLDNGNGLNWI